MAFDENETEPLHPALSTPNGYSVPDEYASGISEGKDQAQGFYQAAFYIDSLQAALTYGLGVGIPFSSISPGGSYKFGDGTLTSPSISLINDPTDGFYRVGSHDEAYVIGSAKVTEWLSAEFRVNYLTAGQIVFPDSNKKLTGSSSLFWDNTNLLLNVQGGTKTLPPFLAGAANGNTDFWVQFGAQVTWTNSNMPGAGNWHTFADMTISSANGIGSASFDAIPQFTGSGNFLDYASHEGRPFHLGSGTITALYGLYWRPTVNTNGTVTSMYGAYIWDYIYASGPVGTVGTYYGLFVDQLAQAGTNYAVYTAGVTKSYFGGSVGFNTTTPRRAIDSLSTTVPQARLTYTDNSVYTDLQTDSSGNFLIKSTSFQVQISDGSNSFAIFDRASNDGRLSLFNSNGQAGLRMFGQAANPNILFLEGGATTATIQTASSVMFISTNTSNNINLRPNLLTALTLTPTRQVQVSQQANGQKISIESVTELTTIAAAATTDTAIQIPLNAVVFAVSVRVTVVIPTAATFTVTGTTSGTQFDVAGGVSTAANTTDVGTANCTYKNGAAQTIRITPNINPAANTGRVRVTIHYYVSTPATS